MGVAHTRVSSLVLGQLHSFENFPYQASVTTYSANSAITDSAAAATAIASGRKVNNGVVAMAIPGDGADLESLQEYFQLRGKSVGIVTSTDISDATPAAFAAHETSRNNYAQIVTDYLDQTRPDIIFGGAGNGMTTLAAQAAGYTVVTDRMELQALNTETAASISGQFGIGNLPYEYDGLGTLPHLQEMVYSALRILDNNPNGFFLLRGSN
ncbi:MAG: alkaline phosphatase [Deltaproteobacteria bacterium]|nr:alkaline phosphatase [Deltaproteobacteria bacterium]